MLDQQQIQALLLPRLHALENERKIIYQQMKKNKLLGKLAVIGSVVLGVVVALFRTIETDAIRTPLLFFCLAALSTFSYTVFHQLKGKSEQLKQVFELRVKTDIYRGVFQTWNSTTNYQPESMVEESYYKKGALHLSYQRYSGDDYCEGTLADGREFRFSELLTQQVQLIAASDGSDTERNILVFKGLFFVLEDTLPYPGFEGRVLIRPKAPRRKKITPKKITPSEKAAPNTYNDTILDADLSNFVPTSKTALEPLPPLFDRLYEVDDYQYSSAREQLSEKFCDQLNYIRTAFQYPFSISFYENKAYFSTTNRFDFWPVSVEHSLLTKARVKHVAWNFKMAFTLLETVASVTPSTQQK